MTISNDRMKQQFWNVTDLMNLKRKENFELGKKLQYIAS